MIFKFERSLWEQDQGNQHNPLLQNPSFQQQNSTLNGPTPMSSSGFATSSALNSAILGLSGTRFTGVSSSQVFNTQAPQFASLLRYHIFHFSILFSLYVMLTILYMPMLAMHAIFFINLSTIC